MIFRLLACLTLVASLEGRGWADDPPAPTVEIAREHDRYVAGEPIGVVITVRNPAAVPIHLACGYPLLVREFKVVEFEGDATMPPIPEPEIALWSGPIGGFTVDVPAGGTWTRRVFLQHYLRRPPPGPHQVRCRFRTAYRVGDDETRSMPLAGRATLAIEVAPADPALLDRRMRAFARAFEATDPDGDLQREAIEALRAYDGPGVIPYVVEALRANGIDRPNHFDSTSDDLLWILRSYKDAKPARDGVIGLLDAPNPDTRSRAASWLREAEIPIPLDAMLRAFDQGKAQGYDPVNLLRHLRDLPVDLVGPLRDRVRRCLDSDFMVTESLALQILARAKVPPDDASRAALDRVAADLKSNGAAGGMDVADAVDLLTADRRPLPAGAVRKLLTEAFVGHVNGRAIRAIDAHMLALGVAPYAELGPMIRSGLAGGEEEETALLTLRAMDGLGLRLTADEFEALAKRSPSLKQAAADHRARHP